MVYIDINLLSKKNLHADRLIKVKQREYGARIYAYISLYSKKRTTTMMKQKTFNRLLLLVLTLGLCSSCSKEESELPAGYAQNNMTNSMQGTQYEAQWVVNQQVVDKTQMTINGNTISVAHMPNEFVVRPFLPTNEQTADIKNISYPEWHISPYGYTLDVIYNEQDNTEQWSHYMVEVGKTIYRVDIQATLLSMWDTVKDTWTIVWSVQKVKIYNMYSSLVTDDVNTLEPPLPLTLVTTKRLN